MRRVEPGRVGRWTAGVVAACMLASLAVATSAAAQEPQVAPQVPAGVRVAVLPVQAVSPLPSGAWPGGASSRADARSRMDGEMTFALSESEAASRWTGPQELVRMLERNPTVDTDPRHLAVRSLARLEPGEDRITEPLHSQLRRLSALAGTRLVLIPLSLEWRAAADSGEADAEADRGRRSGEEEGRAALRLALVDTRAGLLLWRGELTGQPSPAESSAALATLASGLVRTLAP